VARLFEQRRAGGGQGDAALAAVEDHDAELLLELANLLTHRRARAVQTLRRLLKSGSSAAATKTSRAGLSFASQGRRGAPAFAGPFVLQCADPREISMTFGVSMTPLWRARPGWRIPLRPRSASGLPDGHVGLSL
jgi:hypothetical protein